MVMAFTKLSQYHLWHYRNLNPNLLPEQMSS